VGLGPATCFFRVVSIFLSTFVEHEETVNKAPPHEHPPVNAAEGKRPARDHIGVDVHNRKARSASSPKRVRSSKGTVCAHADDSNCGRYRPALNAGT
jgi:hypothetical protein